MGGLAHFSAPHLRYAMWSGAKGQDAPSWGAHLLAGLWSRPGSADLVML